MNLSCQHLTIGYGQSVVQRALDLSVAGGTMVCMLGQNGCGKSTLLRTIAGLQSAIEGNISFCLDNGKTTDIQQLSAIERAQRLSLVLTERLSIDSTTVHDVVAMGRYPYTSFLGHLTDDDEHIVEQAMEQTGVLFLKDKFFNRLSDGEKQRVLIAKALAQHTPIILLDEPTAHLDLPNRIRILSLLRELAHSTNRIVIISTHELDLALQLADMIWLMVPITNNIKTEGKSTIYVGTPHELLTTDVFQSAFKSAPNDRFSIITTDGHLQVVTH